MDRKELIQAGGVRGLAGEIATRDNDPLWYSGLFVLPNPDTVLRKLGRAHDVFDAISGDAHVMGELRSVRAGLLRFEWRLVAGGEGRADKRALALCERLVAERPADGRQWSDVLWAMAQAVFRGYQVHEVVWRRFDDVLMPAAVKDRPSRRFAFGPEGDLRLLTRQHLADGEPARPGNFLLTRHMPSYDNPYGAAVFSACFWPYTFKHSGLKWFTKFAEKHGIPWTIGRYPSGTNPDTQDELANKLAQLVEDGVAAIPEGGSVELLEHKGGGEALHSRFVNLMNRELSKALTSQTLATEIQDTGARAASETHAARQVEVSESDRGIIEETMSELCAWVTRFNVPKAQPPRFEFFEESEARADWAETFDKARAYLEIPKRYAHQRLQIPEPEGGEDVLPMETTPGARLLDRTTADTATGRRSQTGAARGSEGDQVGQEGAEMARGCPSCGHEFRASEDAVQGLVDQAVRDGDRHVSAMVERVRLLLADARDLDEFEAGLATLYPELSEADLATFIEQAMTVGALAGMDGVNG